MGKVLRSKYRTMKLRKNKVSDSSLNTTLNGSVLSENDPRSGVVTPSSGRASVTPRRRYRYTPLSRSGRVTSDSRYFDDVLSPAGDSFTPVTPASSRSRRRKYFCGLAGGSPRDPDGRCYTPSGSSLMYTPKSLAAAATPWLHSGTATDPVDAQMWNFLGSCDPHGDVWRAIINILKVSYRCQAALASRGPLRFRTTPLCP